MTEPTIHASAVRIGERGVLVRGPSGSGKSSLVLQLLTVDATSRLVADDRVVLRAREGRVFAAPPAALAGLLEIRGQGIRRLPHAATAALSLVVDIVEEGQSPRMPTAAERTVAIAGIALPRIFIARGAFDGAARVVAALNWPVLENA